VWNNKGGVGKTTLTYHLSTHYAKTHPGERVLVIDMCPQANISSALLGFAGDFNSDQLNQIRNEKVKEFWGDEDDSDTEDESKSQSYFKSISGYLMMRAANRQTEAKVDPRRYIVKVNEENQYMPGNLYLLLGDETLELTIKAVEHNRNAGNSGQGLNPWKDGTILVKRMIEKYAKKLRRIEDVEGLTVFIDTNPAFSAYTELAIAASNRLILPLNADDFSRAAANSMLANIYGYEFNHSYDDPSFSAQKERVFAYRAKKENLELPRIHLAINNRVIQYALRSSKANRAMGDSVVEALFKAYKKRPEIFTKTNEDTIQDEEAFKRHFFYDLKDFHKTAIQSIHCGMPLSAMMNESTLKIAEEKAKVDKKNVESCLQWVKKIVNQL